MVSPLLAKAVPHGREIVNVTPERAGWTHVGFRALRLRAEEVESIDTGVRELCLVVLTGTVTVTVDGMTH
ncbi:MAG: 5-deoxy-glucuronate isomerase, partial [Pseudomonadota bacterium]